MKGFLEAQINNINEKVKAFTLAMDSYSTEDLEKTELKVMKLLSTDLEYEHRQILNAFLNLLFAKISERKSLPMAA